MSNITDKDQLEALAARAEVTWRDCKEDISFYINNYVWIEDPDTEGAKTQFHLWPMQEKALKVMEENRLSIILKARQLGLTWLALALISHQMLFKPGFTANAISRREDDAKELVRRLRFIFECMPTWFIQEKRHAAPGWNGPVWTGGTEQVNVVHHSGEHTRFKSFPASPESGRSFTASLVLLDEWAFHQFARQIWTAAYPTINRPTGGKVIGISTGKRNTLFEQKWEEAMQGTSKFQPIFLPWTADPRRDQDWYADAKVELGQAVHAEYPATPEEAFTVGEGAMFEQWNPDVHVPFPADWYPPITWRIVRAYDGGYRRACCKWYAISPDGWAVCYREYYPKNKSDPEQAEDIRALSKDPDGAPEDIAYTVADTSCWSPGQETGRTTAQIFAEHGVPMIQAKKDRENGWRRLHQHLTPYEDEHGNLIARLRFTKACKNSIRTYPVIEAHEQNPEDIAIDQEDHPQDTDRYYAMSRPGTDMLSEEMRARRREQRKKKVVPLYRATGY